MNEDPKTRVHRETGFILPDAYAMLLSQGRLQFGENRQDWLKNSHEILRNRPPALCCSPYCLTVEWFDVERLIQSWASSDYWPPATLLAFAGDGYGNYWCWSPEGTNENGTPVVFYDRDKKEIAVFAASFGDFLYRILLESFARISHEHFDEVGVDNSGFKEYLALHVTLVEPYLDRAQVVTLRRILENDLVENEGDESYALLSKLELDKIVERDILRKQKSLKYRWMERRFDSGDLQTEERPTRVDVWLLRNPPGGLSGMLKISKRMNLSLPMSDFRSILANLPYRLSRNVTIHPNMAYVAEINSEAPCLGVFEVDKSDRPVVDSRWDWRHEELIPS